MTITVCPLLTSQSRTPDQVVDVVHVKARCRLVQHVDLGVTGHLDRQLQPRTGRFQVVSSGAPYAVYCAAARLWPARGRAAG